jgi:hypothetical protein
MGRTLPVVDHEYSAREEACLVGLRVVHNPPKNYLDLLILALHLAVRSRVVGRGKSLLCSDKLAKLGPEA